METLLKIVQTVNMYLSDYVLVILLIGAGLYFTIRTKFVQVRCFGEGWRRFFGEFSLNGEKHKAGMSSFQALATAVAAQVGTGNIVGACGAILIGGPGAIFWMWFIAFFGMATIYAEAVLAQETRVVEPDGTILGGPVYYIKHAFPNGFGKFLAGFFAVAIILALGFMGSMVQSNSIGEACQNAFHIPSWVMGLIVCAIAAFIFIGGVQRIASVTEKIVPVMACLYLLGGFIVLIARIRYVPETFGMIFKYAFMPDAIIGGGIGYALKTAISQGAKRGLFSNEAGMGSTPHAHALAKVKRPQDQGEIAIVSVFIDTFVVLTLTAMVILTSGMLNPGAPDGLQGTELAQAAFSASLGTLGGAFVAICMLFFAFSTIIGWYFFGESNVNALFKGSKKATFLYGVIALVFIVVGSFQKVTLVWDMSDMFNGLMVIPNLLAVLALSGIVAKFAKDDTYLGKE